MAVATATSLSLLKPVVSQADESWAEGAEVLEMLFAPDRRGARQALTEARRRHVERPGDLAAAMAYTRGCVDAFRAEGDPRHLSYAEAALGPWWRSPFPPPDIRLWRAMIRQSRHHFGAARHDLEALTREQPGNAQAWLTLGTVLMVMGEVEDARVACGPLRALAGDFVFTVADAGAASLAGEAETSRQRLVQLLADPARVPSGLGAWAHGTLADICERLGRRAEAEVHFQSACRQAPDSPYSLAAWADFLVEEGRCREAAELLRPHLDHDGLLLRWACAKARLGEWDGPYADAVVSLRAAERTAAVRGEHGHAREEAMMHLVLLDEPGEALDRALRNWQVQREPADARLLVACARAARRPDAAESVRGWKRKLGMEDVVLDRLLASLDNLP